MDFKKLIFKYSIITIQISSLFVLPFSLKGQNNPQHQMDSVYMNLDTSFMNTKYYMIKQYTFPISVILKEFPIPQL